MLCVCQLKVFREIFECNLFGAKEYINRINCEYIANDGENWFGNSPKCMPVTRFLWYSLHWQAASVPSAGREKGCKGRQKRAFTEVVGFQQWFEWGQVDLNRDCCASRKDLFISTITVVLRFFFFGVVINQKPREGRRAKRSSSTRRIVSATECLFVCRCSRNV